MTPKCGNDRNVEKPINVMLVPHNTAALDPILHLAAHARDKSNGIPLFTARLTYKAQGRDSFTKMVQRRDVAILLAVCFALDISNWLGRSGAGEKLLHCFRVLC
jgi:hypothetical protein